VGAVAADCPRLTVIATAYGTGASYRRGLYLISLSQPGGERHSTSMKRTMRKVRQKRGLHWCDRGGVGLCKPLPVWPLFCDENGILIYSGDPIEPILVAQPI
jgi:hypothetical protein